GLLKWVQDDCALHISDRGFGKFPELPVHCFGHNNPSITTKKSSTTENTEITEENNSFPVSSESPVVNRFAFVYFFRRRRKRTAHPAGK
ncbi:MAG: hypothetical protein QG652_1475, partial [Pseudomonadota bacterium]|nr:hypothetical protein [Pseudomonadota bacterium]